MLSLPSEIKYATHDMSGKTVSSMQKKIMQLIALHNLHTWQNNATNLRQSRTFNPIKAQFQVLLGFL